MKFSMWIVREVVTPRCPECGECRTVIQATEPRENPADDVIRRKCRNPDCGHCWKYRRRDVPQNETNSPGG